MARIAKSLDTLRAQVNAKWPNRDKSWDGWIGDDKHRMRASDHNENEVGVVAALDITSNIERGLTGDMIADAIAASRDDRVKYMIHRNRIMSGNAGSQPWVWRPRNKGPSDHAHHIHISVGRGPDGRTTNPELYDDPRSWALATQPPPSTGNILFHVKGKMSTFGGPDDKGMTATEGLALFNSAEDMIEHGVAVLPVMKGVTGLGRRLDPNTYYLACRWDYSKTPKKFLQSARATVAANGTSIVARPVDWGPNERTGRVADLSPALARDLGLQTDDVCEVIIRGD